LYGKVATVEILHFLREERKFDHLDILFKQIYIDLANTRLYFLQGNKNNGL
ncbi:MAG: riboflavin kinase, partial [Burkholderiales bacterium]|nr:riboflavin kinase [Burkholderiales bacterium]